MNPQRKLEYLTGFLMGVFFGFGINGFIFVICWIAHWLGLPRLTVSWWMLIPFPLISGLVMSKAIADLHLEDY